MGLRRALWDYAAPIAATAKHHPASASSLTALDTVPLEAAPIPVPEALVAFAVAFAVAFLA